jgi:hypothetical protein
MGCKLVRGETIYFVRHGGITTPGLVEAEWYLDDSIDHRLLPKIYVNSSGRECPRVFSSVIPIEIRTFETS